MPRHNNDRPPGRGLRGPNLPVRTQDQESFRRNIPFPSGSEENFARNHAELYGDEEQLVDGHHTGSAHFPRRSERAVIHREYTTSSRHRDRTRTAYEDEFIPANNEYNDLGEEQRKYYEHTSDGMLPRHHATLLPLAREREGPNYHNAVNRERLLTREYAYHNLEEQQFHWGSADEAYGEHRQAQDDHARHRKYRSDLKNHDTLDCYSNSPVHDTKPQSRSLNHGLPPSGTYCDRLSTPPGEDDLYTDQGHDYR